MTGDWRSEFEEQQEREYWEWVEAEYFRQTRDDIEMQSRCRG